MSAIILTVLTIASFFGPIWMRANAAKQERAREAERFWTRAAMIERLRDGGML